MTARLTQDMLLPQRPLGRLAREVLLFDELDSTNAWLLGRAEELPDGTSAWAEWQSAGRGRLGRKWLSPRGASVLMSVLLHEPADSPLVGRATLIAALAACEAVEHATLCQPAIRWPNDLVLGGRKLGGVLVESRVLAARERRHAARRALVMGVGINCLQQRGHLTGPLAEIATSLEIETAHAVDRAAVARALLERLDAHLTTAATKDGGPQLLADWKRRCADLGARVRLQHNRRGYTGTVLDIADNGDLLVQLDVGGRRYFDAATTTRLT